MADYPELKPNSDAYLEREAAEKGLPPRDIPALANKTEYRGKVVERKVSIPEKIFRFFVDDDVPDVGEWIMRRVVRPMVLGWVGDLLGSMGDALVKGRRYSGYSDRYDEEYVSYDNYSRNKRRDDGRPKMRVVDDRRNFREYGFERRSDAERALEDMKAFIRRGNKCTVADYYRICTGSHVGDYTDRYFGWDSLKGVTVFSHRGMYYIDLPRPIEFE